MGLLDKAKRLRAGMTAVPQTATGQVDAPVEDMLLTSSDEPGIMIEPAPATVVESGLSPEDEAIALEEKEWLREVGLDKDDDPV